KFDIDDLAAEAHLFAAIEIDLIRVDFFQEISERFDKLFLFRRGPLPPMADRVLAWPSPRNQKWQQVPPSSDPPVPASYRENLIRELSEFESLYRQPCARDPAARLHERASERQKTT